MPLFESEHEKRSRVYRERQRNIDRNIQWQRDRTEAQDRAQARANQRAVRERNMNRAAAAIGTTIGLAEWALHKDAKRQARIRQEQAAQAAQQPQQAPGAPQQPQAPTAPGAPYPGAQQAYTAPQATSEAPLPPYVGPGAQHTGVPLVNGVAARSAVPWGILSIILGALFFFAPLSSIAGVVLGVVGLRQNVDGNPKERKLNLIGIGISVLVLLGFLFLFIVNMILTGLGHMLGG